LSGYYAALKAFDLPVAEELVSAEDFDGNLTFGEVTRLLDIEPPPSAILLGGIEMLPGAIKAIRAKGLVIPNDISLIGLGDSDLSALTTPPISIVRWNASDIGRELARLLLDRLSGAQLAPRRRLMYEAELVVRGSCAPPKVRDAGIR
jgi:LacI family transcriptional regulator